ncbi:putative ribonuclease H-like domain-containing protein [Tanacetum coccineum]
MAGEDEFHDDNPPPPLPVTPTQQAPHTLSTIKLPILKKGVSTEDANQKFLRSLPASWSQVSLIMRTKPGVDTLSFDDLYNNLRVFESDIKGSTASSSSTQNVAFVSSESTNSTNDVSIAYGVSTSSGYNSQKEGSSSYTDELKYSFFANQSSGPQLDHEDLEQVDEFDLEEMDLKWQVAMISMRLKKFYKKTGRRLQFDAKEPVGFDKTKEEPKALVTLDGEGVDWTGHAEDEQENFALMAYSNSGSDTEREQLGDASIEIKAYTLALAKVEAQLVCHQKNQLAYEEKIRLGNGKQIHEVLKVYEKEVLESVFDSRSSDVEDSPVYDRFAKVEGMHAVPPPMTGNYMPPKSDFGIDESNFTYGPKQSKTSESDAKTSDFDSCETNSSVETLESVPKPVVVEPRVVSQPKVWSDAPIIEEYESESDDEYVIKPSKEQENPSFVVVNTVKHVKTPREIVKEQNTYRPINTARQNLSSQTAATSTARKINTARPIVNEIRPRNTFYKSHSPIRRPFNKSTAPKANFTNHKVNTARDKTVSAVRGYRETADDPQKALKNKGIVDSRCSRHMTGNKAYLVEYQDYNGGHVAFGGSKGYISGKGKIKTRKLDFEDVCFVKELQHFNLFSVSQMCDKKNKVLFTDTECLVLSPDFKLPDENQVLLRVPRQNNMYSFNLENIVPTGGLACLIAKATVDESNKWHRRLGHVNFKNLNKLVKGNLVRGLPQIFFQNEPRLVLLCRIESNTKPPVWPKFSEPSESALIDVTYESLFGPTSVRSINHKTYYLVITDDFKFKNRDIIEFCGSKGIKREYSNARTPQQNGVAERKNRTLIKAARTMLADSFLPNTFWAEAVSTACYVLNRVLVTKPQNKTPYELITGKIPIISYIRPFGCHVTILNTIDHLGKFEEKFDEGFLVGYSLNSKAFRVYNLETKRVEENLHINFLENKPNVAGKGPNWLFDLDYLTDSMNYQPVTTENKANKTAGPKEANHSAGTQDNIDAGNSEIEAEPAQEYFVLPLWSSYTSTVKSSEAKNGDEKPNEDTEKEANDATEVFRKEFAQCTKDLLLQAGAIRATSTNTVNTVSTPISTASPSNGAVADFTNLETTVNVSLIPTSRIHFIHPTTQILGDPTSAVQTRSKREIRTKWVYRNKKDERGVVVRNKARLVSQGYRQEEGIDYDEVFALMSRIKAIGIFLAFTSYMGFIVYQMDVKSAFLYGMIDEEVYVSQPLGFVDPKFPKKVYKIVKVLYGLHQAPRASYATLSTLLLKSGYRGGTIDKTLFIKKEKNDIMLVQVYMDDIIFGSTKRSWCDEIEALMMSRFQMSYMGELTFFLGLQVKQKEDGIFISQDKYVAEILKKFDFASVKIASTLIETQKSLTKDEEAADVDVHHYRSVIGSLMYLTTSRYPRVSSFDLEAYSNSDYARENLDRKSTTEGCQFLSRRLISWQRKKQTIMATSTTEAEYVAAANCCGQVLWIQNQMLDYGFNFMNTKIYIDNKSTICIVKNPVFHSKTKHIEIRHHFIRDAYEKKLIQVLKIHTDDNVADLLTKAFDVNTGSPKLCTARPKLSTNSTKIESMKLEAMVEERRIFKCWFHYHTTNGHQFTMSNRHQELASPEQTTSGKDFSNPLMADSLPKTICEESVMGLGTDIQKESQKRPNQARDGKDKVKSKPKLTDGPTDSVFRPNLRTCPPSLRSPAVNVPVTTVAVTTTVTAYSFAILPPKVRVKSKNLEIFGDSASTGGANANVVGTSKLNEPADSSYSFYASQDLDSETLHRIYVPKWNVTNDSVLDDPYVCHDLTDSLAPPTHFSQLRAAALLSKRDTKIAHLKSLLSLKEAEATEAIRLHGQLSVVEADDTATGNELRDLKERNFVLKGEKDVLSEKVTTLESVAALKETELVSLTAQVTQLTSELFGFQLSRDELSSKVASLESERDTLADQSPLESAFELFKVRMETMQDEQAMVLGNRVADLDAHLLEIDAHLDEEFYPRFLTAISGRWQAIGCAINKGIQDGLRAGVDHGKDGRDLSVIEAYDPFAEAKYIDVVNAFGTVDFSLLSELKSKKDASIVDLMDSLHLEGPLAEIPRAKDLQPSPAQLMLPIHMPEDNVEKRLSLTDAMVPLVEPLSSKSLIGKASTSVAPATSEPITTLSMTFASSDVVPPLSISNDQVLDMELHDEDPPAVTFEKEELNTSPEYTFSAAYLAWERCLRFMHIAFLRLHTFHVRGRMFPLRSLSLYAPFPNAFVTLYGPSYLGPSLPLSFVWLASLFRRTMYPVGGRFVHINTLYYENPLFDEEIEDISSLDPPKSAPLNYEPLGNPDSVSRSLETSDLNLEELTAKIGLDDSIPTEIDDGYYDLEGDILFLEHLIEETFSDPTPVVLPKKSTLLVTPSPASKQFSLREVEIFDPFFSLTQSGEKTRVMETSSFGFHHMPSPCPAAYLPKEVMYRYYHPYLTSGDGFDPEIKKELGIREQEWEKIQTDAVLRNSILFHELSDR